MSKKLTEICVFHASMKWKCRFLVAVVVRNSSNCTLHAKKSSLNHHFLKHRPPYAAGALYIFSAPTLRQSASATVSMYNGQTKCVRFYCLASGFKAWQTSIFHNSMHSWRGDTQPQCSG